MNYINVYWQKGDTVMNDTSLFRNRASLWIAMGLLCVCVVLSKGYANTKITMVRVAGDSTSQHAVNPSPQVDD